MYEMMLGSINIGGGLMVYSIEEIQKTHETPPLASEFIPIGYVLENHLLISRTAIEEKGPNFFFDERL